jgi:FtsP/CotA-like multicopper oxidase with cupredoxin domain
MVYASTVMPSSASGSASTCTLLPNTPLTNYEQVGNSTWGTLCQPYFPQWLGDSATAPWGENRTVENSDASIKDDVPVTGVTRYYDFTISRSRISADGVLRDVILVNDQFPGPAIEANWGDWIQVTVHNNITDPWEGTSLHWHGQLQKSTPWEDGVPSAGQCPIAPGSSFTYNFQAELHGTSWYHAHYSAQFTAGVAGPIIVHGPTSLPYDIDVGPVMLSDWYHIPYFSIVSNVVGTDFSLVPPTSDSLLINGRGNFDCSQPSYDNSSDWLGSNLKSNISWTCVDDASLASFRFQSNKVHRLRLINHGANGVQKFTIDNHNLTVIALDLVPVQPYTTDVVTLGVGARADILVTALNTPTASIWMRTYAPGTQECGGSSQGNTSAAIYYENADTSVLPTSQPFVVMDNTCAEDSLALKVPAYAVQPSANHWKQDLSLTLEVNETNQFEFRINGEAWHADYSTPLLPQIAAGNFSFEPHWQVYNFFDNTSIIFNITNNMPLYHPFHLHGHNFYVLDVGTGPTSEPGSVAARQAGPRFANGATWDGSVVNPGNPMRRDTVLIPPYGYAAIQFELDNPGVWPLHCHVAWHLSGGQGLNVIYKADQIPALPDGFIDGTCDAWNAYTTNDGPVDQIDAGA